MAKIVLIGGSKSNVGKTTLLRIILSLYKGSFIAIKITNNTEFGESITEETYDRATPYKDTFYMLQHSKKVFWARGSFTYLKENLPKLILSLQDPIIAEGNLLQNILHVDQYYFVTKEGIEEKKESKIYKEKADFIIVNGNYEFKIDGKVVYVDLLKNLKHIELPFENFLLESINKIF